jgi:hypothetical protein
MACFRLPSPRELKFATHTTPIKLKKPLSDEMCLKCHEHAKPFLSEPLHLDAKTGQVQPLILKGTIRCEMCHPSGHMVKVDAAE